MEGESELVYLELLFVVHTVPRLNQLQCLVTIALVEDHVNLNCTSVVF